MRVDDRAVAARGLAEAAAMLARGERAELPVDEGDDLLDQVVGVVADRRGIDVLVAAQRGEAVGEDHDRRAHLLLVDRGARRARARCRRSSSSAVCARPEPVKPTMSTSTGKRLPRPRVAPSSYCAGSQTCELAHVRVAQRVALQDLRDVLELDQRAGRPFRSLQCHVHLLKRETGSGYISPAK